MHAVRKKSMDSVRVELTTLTLQARSRGDVTHLRQTHSPESTDPKPTDVELPTLHGEARRTGECVMVVVQLLATEQHAPWRQIRGCRRHLEASIPYGVPEAIHHAAGKERLRDQVNRHHEDRRDAEQDEHGERKQDQA